MSLNQDKHTQALTEKIADMAQADGCTFGIKTVLPCMAAHLQYSQQGTMQNGGQAQRACLRCAPGRRKRTRPTHHQSRTPANQIGLAGVLWVGHEGYGGDFFISRRKK